LEDLAPYFMRVRLTDFDDASHSLLALWHRDYLIVRLTSMAELRKPLYADMVERSVKEMTGHMK